MTVRRQLLNFPSRSVDVRIGFDALEDFSRMVRGTVGVPRRAALVSASPLDEDLKGKVVRGAIDAGFEVVEVPCALSASPLALDDATGLLGALGEACITRDDVVIAVGDFHLCSLATFVAKLWCGGTACALVPTTLDAMVRASTTAEPLSVGGVEGMASLQPEPSLVVCDPTLVIAAEPEERLAGYVHIVATSLADSRKSWDRLGGQVERLAQGDEIALIDALSTSQLARRSVLTAANPSSRHALEYGFTTARALRACLGADIPFWKLVAEGMRFESRLATEVTKFAVDEVFEQDDRLDDLGVAELAFDLDPARFIAAIKETNARRSNRLFFALPRNPGIIRLAAVPDDVLERHAEAYLASRAELLAE